MGRGKHKIEKENNLKLKSLVILILIIVSTIILYNTVFSKVNKIITGDSLNETSLKFKTDETEFATTKNLEDGDYIYLSDMEYTNQSKTGWGNIQKNKNSDGNTIKLIKEGEIVSYPKGMGFHANGCLIYDISNYSDKFTRFISDIGVDASRPEVATIKVQIFVSDDGSKWDRIKVDGLEEILRAANPCVSVDINIEGKKYLKIEVNMADNTNASDHCVLGDAKIAKKDYKDSSEKFENLKKIEEYDKIIKESSDYEKVVKEHNKEILAREFVNRFGYYNLQNLASTDENCSASMNWIFTNEKVLEYVIDVGEINDAYTFLNSLGSLYNAEYSKIKGDKDEDLYIKMIVALSAAYSTDRVASPFSFSHLSPSYNVTDRFEKMKELYNEKKLAKEFGTLKVQLLRMVMQDAVREDEAEWFNYWTRGGKIGEYTGVFDTGAFWLSYISPNYNRDENFDPTQRSKFDTKYKLSEHKVPFGDGTIYRYWMAYEYGGICWNCSRVGQSSYRVNGLPATGIYQPSHEAFVGYSETTEGKGYWAMGNNIFGWGRSCTTWGGGNGYRLLLNWGNKTFGAKTVSGSNAGNNVGYIILAQENINDYDNFIKSSRYNLIANTYNENDKKIEIYKKALEVDKINLDSYDYLIKLYEKMEDEITEQQWLELANQIIDAYKYFPNAMDDLVKLIKPHITDSAKIIEIEIKETAALNEAMNLSKEQNIQYSEIKSLASVILGSNNTQIATFAFDGKKAGEIIIADGYNINWSFSVNGKDGNYSEVTNNHEVKLTEEQLNSINENDDIHIKIDGTTEIYTIDILKAQIPVKDGDTVLYANDDENRVLGTDNTMEWRITEETIVGDNYEVEVKKHNDPWTSYAEKAPDLSGFKNIEIRVAANGNYLASEVSEEFKFTDYESWLGEYLPEIAYIPVSNMKIKEVSTEAVEHAGSANNLIDGNLKTRYHSNWQGNDDKRFVIIELDREFSIERLEYFAAGGGNGKILDGSVYGCTEEEFNDEDQEQSTWHLLCQRTFYQNEYNDNNPEAPKEFEVPSDKIRKVKYVKLVGNRTSGGNGYNWFAGRMIKLYRSTADDPDPSGVIDYSITKPTQGEVIASVANIIPSSAKVIGESSHTFTNNGTYTFEFQYSSKDFQNPDAPAVVHKGQATAVVNNIDREIKIPEVIYSTTKLTNDSVKVTIKPKEDILIINNGKFSINEDGKIVKDETGEIIEDFITDSKGNVIDPNVEIKENAEGDEKEKNILERAKNKVLENGTTISSDFEYDFMSNETSTIKFVDRAGNIGEVQIKVDCIDNIPPVGIIEYSTTSSTDDSVEATVSFAKVDEDGNVIYNENGEIEEEKNIEIIGESENTNEFSYSKGSDKVTFNKNGKFTFKFKDEAGNIGEAEAEVSWIKQIIESDKFKIINKKIKRVDPDTYTVKEFKDKLKSEYNITVLDDKGSNIENEETEEIKTGMNVNVNGNIYTVIVSGDVNRDGKLNSTDIDKECKHYLGKEELQGYYLDAGDYDENGEITLKDAGKMYSEFNKKNTNNIINKTKIRTRALNKSTNQITAYISTSDLEKDINAISGTINYDKNILTLVKIESENTNWRVNDNEDKFIALRNKASKENEEVIKLKFDIKNSKEGEIEISLSNVKISDGEFEEDNTKNINVNIIETKQDVPVESVKIDSSSEKFDKEKKTATLEVTDTIFFHAIIMPEHATDTNVTWSTDENSEEYISIDGLGKVTAKKVTDEEGVKIKATVDGKTDEVTIKIVETEVTEISDELESSDIYLVEPTDENTENSSVKIAVKVLPENATNKEVKWETDNDKVATVEDGIITAVKDEENSKEERICKVTVTSESNKNVKKEYTIHVVDKIVPVTNVSIETKEEKTELTVGETLNLFAKIEPNTATFKEMKWEVEDNNEVITVSNSGLVHALKEGEAKVKLIVTCQEEDCTGHTAEIVIKVSKKADIEVTEVQIQGENKFTVKQNTETKLHVLVLPDDATNKEVTWESSDNEIISVTKDGVIFAKGVGRAVITAKCGNAEDSVEVTVESVLKTNLTIYTMNKDKKFISGLTLKLDKIIDGLEIKIDELSTNGKYDFKNLEDGEYIIRVYKPLKENQSDVSKNGKLLVTYKLKITNGKVIFEENGKEVSATDLVFILSEENESELEDGKDYPNIEKDYEDYVNTLENEKDSDKNKPDSDSSSSNKNNNKDKNNKNSSENSKGTSSKKTDLVDTSDTKIDIYISMLIISFTVIVLVNKKLKKMKRK